MTVTDLITEASILSGITAIGEVLDGAAAAYGFSKLNQMVDMWATDRLAIYRRQRAGPFSLTSGTASYSVGSGATWNVARPLWIDGAGIIVDNTLTYPVEVPMDVLTLRRWQEILVKTVQSPLPRQLWFDQTFPSGTAYVYPVPSTSTPKIILYIPIAVTEFATQGAAISLPPGYRMALVSNLAVLMATGLRDIPADVKEIAIASLSKIKAANLTGAMDALECEQAVLSPSNSFNYYTGNVK